MTNTELKQLFSNFTNEAVCRRICNQAKANAIFNIIQPHLDRIQAIDVIDSWTEYKNGDINQDEFGTVIKEIQLAYDKS